MKDKKVNKWATTVDDQGREGLINKDTGEVKGKGFGTVDRSILPDIQKLIKKHPSAAEVLFFFARVADKNNVVDMPQDEIRQKSGFNRSKIQSAVGLLNKRRFILIENKGRCNKYFINDRFFWQKSFSEKQYKSSHTGAIIWDD
jgi:hypothetical protein